MKKSKAVRPSQFRTGEPLSYGSNLGLPRPQERVPRSIERPLSPSRKSGLTLLQRSLLGRFSPAKPPLSFLRGRPAQYSASRTTRASVPTTRLWSRAYNPMHVLRVANPKRVLFCVKRKIRREVLFAIGKSGRPGRAPGRLKSGKGGGFRRTYTRNGNSLYGC